MRTRARARKNPLQSVSINNISKYDEIIQTTSSSSVFFPPSFSPLVRSRPSAGLGDSLLVCANNLSQSSLEALTPVGGPKTSFNPDTLPGLPCLCSSCRILAQLARLFSAASRCSAFSAFHFAKCDSYSDLAASKASGVKGSASTSGRVGWDEVLMSSGAGEEVEASVLDWEGAAGATGSCGRLPTENASERAASRRKFRYVVR